MEYARNVLNIQDADHQESSPEAAVPVIGRLACSLVGQTQAITIAPGTLAAEAYGADRPEEQFFCNYGLNPAYRAAFDQTDFKVTGVDSAGEVRIFELAGHPFFLGTLFLPQVRSRAGEPHPLVVRFLRSVVES